MAAPGPYSIKDTRAIETIKWNEIYRSRFGNAGDFVFAVVGDFNWIELESLIEKYLATLPTFKAPEKVKNHHFKNVKGQIFRKNISTDRKIHFHVQLKASKLSPYNLEDDYYLDLAQEVLRRMLLDEIRRKNGALIEFETLLF